MLSTPCFRAVQTILEIKQAFELQVSRGCHCTHQLDNLLQYLEPVLPGRTLSINARQMQQENISSSLSAESCGKFILEARSNSSDKNDFARRTFLSTGVIPIRLPRVMLWSWKKDLVDTVSRSEEEYEAKLSECIWCEFVDVAAAWKFPMLNLKVMLSSPNGQPPGMFSTWKRYVTAYARPFHLHEQCRGEIWAAIDELAVFDRCPQRVARNPSPSAVVDSSMGSNNRRNYMDGEQIRERNFQKKTRRWSASHHETVPCGLKQR